MNIKRIYTALIAAAFCVLLVSCGQEFDRPPFDEPVPRWEANISIKDVLEYYDAANKYTVVDTNLVIEGIVTANDISGNVYKKIFLQDSSAAIDVEINLNSIYNQYRVGQRLVINLNGLAMGNYRGQPQLAAAGDGETVRLTELQCAEHIDRLGFPSEYNVPAPKVMTIAEINANYTDYIGQLMQVNNISFVDSGKVFADPNDEIGNATNRVIQDATGTLTSRNSIYALFASDILPSGKGNVVGILGVFGTDVQFFFRDKKDVMFPENN